MKKRLIILFLILTAAHTLTNPLMAQKYPAAKYSNLLSGGLSYASAGGNLYDNSSCDRLIQAQFNSSWAYFVANGLGVGINLNVSSRIQGEVSSTSLAFGPTIRYFISSNYQPEEISGKVYPYFSMSFLAKSLLYQSRSEDTSYSGLLCYLGGGTAIMLTKSVAFNIELGFQVESLDKQIGNSIDFQIGILVFF